MNQDMEIYRRANVWEHVLCLYQTTTVSIKKKVQHLLYRATQVGGSTTLITRAGIIHWIQSEIYVANSKEAAVLAELAREIYDTCDQERINEWSMGRMGKIVQDTQDLLSEMDGFGDGLGLELGLGVL